MDAFTSNNSFINSIAFLSSTVGIVSIAHPYGEVTLHNL